MVIVRSAPGASIDATDASNAFAHMIRVSPVGVVMPEVPLPNDLKMSATRANSWIDGRGQRFVLLDGDPRLRIGSYHFRATGMVVRLTPVPGPRPDVYSVAIFLDELTELGGYGPIRQSAEHLLVTAHIEGAVQLETDRLIREPADAGPLVTEARARFARHEAALVQNITNLSDVPDMDIADATRQQRRRQLTSRRSSVPKSVIDIIEAEQDRRSIGPVEAPADPSATAVDLDPSDDQSPGFQLPGRVLYAADSWEFQVGDAESTLTLVGNIRVVYLDPQTKRGMTLTADKAVIFLDVGGFDPDAGQALTAGTVRGVYLEDHVVATDGDYTLRGPRVFYDLTTDRAIVLDAVFHSWDIKQKVPIYVRAESLRQLSRTQWSATNARLTTSEFHEPHFAIGMNKLVVTQHDNEDQPTQFSYVANDTSLNIGSTPVFGWPTLSGDATKPPIRAIDVGYDSQNGAEIQTRWDIFALMDKRPPDGLDASLLIDGFTRRGAAIGIEAEYDVPVFSAIKDVD